MTDWKIWLNKKVHIETSKGLHYTGTVIEIDEVGNNLIFILILDKYHKHQMFSTVEIARIEELG